MEDQRDVIAFLSDPRSYGVAGPVESLETHGALVFLIGDRAYKLKRAVRYPYMDYSTLERRARMCARELEVNRRTAPELYLGVRPVVRGSEGLRFGEDGESGIADWVVVMRRFSQGALLETMRKDGRLDAPLMRSLAEAIAAFHGSAEIRRDFGGAEGMRAVIDENAELLFSFAGRPFEADRIAAFRQAAEAMLKNLSALLDARREAGMVRHCHGDMHLNNVCVIGGEPILFDGIEFNDAFANIDTLYDLAFLLMDLDRHGLREFANIVLNRYLELQSDYEGIKALPLFLSARAAIRAHVAASTAPFAKPPSGKFAEAVRHLDQAIDYLAPAAPRVIAIGGVSGTGKSSLSRALAPAFGAAPGAVVLRSDVIRKRMMGVPETEKLPQSAYAPEMHRRVYAEIVARAEAVIASGHAVIADAVFGANDERAAIAAVAAKRGVPFDGIWLTGYPEVLAARIAARRNDASDATVEVLKQQLAHIAPPTDWRHFDAAGARDDVVGDVRRALTAGV